MNISNNISEITTQSAGKTHKTYLWPQYNKGRVNPVQPVKRKLHQDQYYIKPARNEVRQLRQDAENKSRMIYSLEGSLQKSSNINRQPGTFFNALA